MTAQLTREDTFAIATPARGERPVVADPGALGLGAFALTTFALSLSNAGLVPGAGAAVLSLALFYGGAAQLIAGVIEFVKGNVFGATAFTSYGAFWMAFWWLETHPDIAQAAGPAGLGAFLLGWTIFTLFMTVAALRTNGILIVTFTVLSAAFACLTIGAFSGSALIHALGGWLGLVTAFVAWYGSAATVINVTWGRQVLPVWAK